MLGITVYDEGQEPPAEEHGGQSCGDMSKTELVKGVITHREVLSAPSASLRVFASHPGEGL